MASTPGHRTASKPPLVPGGLKERNAQRKGSSCRGHSVPDQLIAVALMSAGAGWLPGSWHAREPGSKDFALWQGPAACCHVLAHPSCRWQGACEGTDRAPHAAAFACAHTPNLGMLSRQAWPSSAPAQPLLPHLGTSVRWSSARMSRQKVWPCSAPAQLLLPHLGASVRWSSAGPGLSQSPAGVGRAACWGQRARRSWPAATPCGRLAHSGHRVVGQGIPGSRPPHRQPGAHAWPMAPTTCTRSQH